jgi:predicted phage-related endonuclease
MDLTPIDQAIVEEYAVTPADVIKDRIAAIAKLKEAEKAVKAKIEEHRTEIASYLENQGAEYGTVDGQIRVRWRTIEGTRIDAKALRSKMPEIAEAFTIPTEQHRLELIGE